MSHNLDYRSAHLDLIVQDLGARLGRIRLSRNINQEALAEKAGLTRRTLSRLETGQGATLDTLVRVLRALDLESHLEALLPDPGIQPMLRHIGKAPERQRARAAPRDTQDDIPEPWTWDEEATP